VRKKKKKKKKNRRESSREGEEVERAPLPDGLGPDLGAELSCSQWQWLLLLLLLLLLQILEWEMKLVTIDILSSLLQGDESRREQLGRHTRVQPMVFGLESVGFPQKWGRRQGCEAG